MIILKNLINGHSRLQHEVEFSLHEELKEPRVDEAFPGELVEGRNMLSNLLSGTQNNLQFNKLTNRNANKICMFS